MFVMTTTSIARNSGVMPRWFQIISILIAIVLFLSYSLSIWLVVAFPVWILAFGAIIILHAYRTEDSSLLPGLRADEREPVESSVIAD
jgi:hypothetical protein